MTDKIFTLASDRNFKMTDIEMVSMWQDALNKAEIKNMEAFQLTYTEDIIKFDFFIFEIDKRYNK